MGLFRHYRLVPLLIACVLLALLAIWKNTATLVPRRHSSSEALDNRPGLSTVAGLAYLLRRSVPAREILQTSWRAFKQPIALRAKLDASTESKIEALLAPQAGDSRAARDPVSTYNRIHTIIRERKLNS